MNIFNSFLYKSISDYIPLNDIINLCKINGNIEICDNKIIGEYFYKETKKNIELNFINNYLEGIITGENTEEMFMSFYDNLGYLTQYLKKTILEDSKSNFNFNTVRKQTIYDQNKKFKKRQENIENISKVSYNNIDFVPIKELCMIENITFLRVDENMLLKKLEINYPYDSKKNKIKYSISTDFKKGVFLSEDKKLEEYFLSFEEISKENYSKILRK